MPNLEQSLHKHDFSHLHIIAQLWGIDLYAKERNKAREELCEKILDKPLANEVVESLSAEARLALNTLLENNGRISWAIFTRQFGEIRELGAGKRDREKPHLTPVSSAETLFYHALIARAFFDTPSGAQEFAYIPADLFFIIAPPQIKHQKIDLGRPARPEEYKYIQHSNDFILDDLTTLLSALRLGWVEPPTLLDTPLRFAREIGLAARLIVPSPSPSARDELQPRVVKSHLEQNRVEAFAELQEIWRKSETFNELHQIPSIICEGEWKNPVLETRKAIFDFLAKIPNGEWWNLNAFIADIKKHHPDFQRKAGEYDAWFIRRAEDGKTLRGFEHWDEVEGALIRYFITGVLFWLRFVDLGTTEKNGDIKAFRIRKENVERKKIEERGKITITSSGKITVSRFAERVARYQISRFGEWEGRKNLDEYKYQLTPSSLSHALEQNLKVLHLLLLLKKYADDKIPPSLERALRRWEINGTEARVERLSVLRLSKPEDLRALRASRAGRFLGEVLSPTRVIVKGGASQKIMSALIELGIFMKDEK